MYQEPSYVLPDGTDVSDRDFRDACKFYDDREPDCITDNELYAYLNTKYCHPNLEPITIEDITQMSYEEWFLANEDQLYAHYMQSGAYTEHDFDMVKAIHNDYQTYLSNGVQNV